MTGQSRVGPSVCDTEAQERLTGPRATVSGTGRARNLPLPLPLWEALVADTLHPQFYKMVMITYISLQCVGLVISGKLRKCVGHHDTVATVGSLGLSWHFLTGAPLYAFPTDEKVYLKYSWEQLWFGEVLLSAFDPGTLCERARNCCTLYSQWPAP